MTGDSSAIANPIKASIATLEATEPYLHTHQRRPEELLRLSGSCEAPIAHHLRNPTFATDDLTKRETVDETNPSLSILLESGFNNKNSLIFDHLARRDAVGGFKGYDEPISEPMKNMTATELPLLEKVVSQDSTQRASDQMMHWKMLIREPLDTKALLDKVAIWCQVCHEDTRVPKSIFLLATNPNGLSIALHDGRRGTSPKYIERQARAGTVNLSNRNHQKASRSRVDSFQLILKISSNRI